MTFGLKNIFGVLDVHSGKEPRNGFLFSSANWTPWQKKLFDYVALFFLFEILKSSFEKKK